MKNISELKSTNEQSVLDLISQSKIFSYNRSKLDERKVLNNINKDKNIRYKVNTAIDTYAKKTFLLLQAGLGNVNIEDWELKRQMTEIFSQANRILKCIQESYIIKNNAEGLIVCYILNKCFIQQMWNDNSNIPMQLPKIGEKLSKAFLKYGYNTMESIEKANPRHIETICGKNLGFGNALIEQVKRIPKVDLTYSIMKTYKSLFKLHLELTVMYKNLVLDNEFNCYSIYYLVVWNCDKSILMEKTIKPVPNTPRK